MTKVCAAIFVFFLFFLCFILLQGCVTSADTDSAETFETEDRSISEEEVPAAKEAPALEADAVFEEDLHEQPAGPEISLSAPPYLITAIVLIPAHEPIPELTKNESAELEKAQPAAGTDEEAAAITINLFEADDPTETSEEPETEIRTEAERESVPEPANAIEPEQGTAPQPEVEPAPIQESAPALEIEPEPEYKTEPEFTAEPEYELEPELAADPEYETEAKPATEPEPEAYPVPPREPEPVPSVKETSQIQAVREQDIRVRLPGSGWIYLGEQNNNDKIRFIEKKREADAEVFVFRAAESGDYVLNFQRQDLRLGTNTAREVRVDVSKEGEQADILEEGIDPVEEGTAVETAAEMENGTATDIKDISEYVDEQLDRGNTEAAFTVLRNNLGIEGDTGRIARRKAVDLTGNGIDVSLLEDALDEMLERGEIDNTDNIFPAIEYLTENNRYETPIAVLEALYKEKKDSEEADRILYLLGSYYEKDSKARNLRKSLRYYEELYDKYPLSDYWDDAEDRINYIYRHFIHIR